MGNRKNKNESLSKTFERIKQKDVIACVLLAIAITLGLFNIINFEILFPKWSPPALLLMLKPFLFIIISALIFILIWSLWTFYKSIRDNRRIDRICKRLEALEKKQIVYNPEMEIGKKILDQGLTKFHFSRDDYGRTLATFLNSANQSISIVSISLKNTDDEGCLTDLFKRKLYSDRNFTISISLINPNNSALIKIVADTLNITEGKLIKEITEMLEGLLNCCDSLNPSEKSRFKVLVHNCFPMGSAVMLDASPSGGIIQVETKLYKAPRVSSFGFQLTKTSPFFKHNFESWQRIIQDSNPFTKDQLIKY